MQAESLLTRRHALETERALLLKYQASYAAFEALLCAFGTSRHAARD
jgi:hypothetical protein